MNNKMLIILIVVIAAVTVIIVSWRTPSSTTITPTPTPTATPTVTDPFVVSPTVTSTTTATPTVTVTATPTVTATATPTPTVATSTFDNMVTSEWIYGVSQQTVGSMVYFISETEPKKVKKGTSVSDVAAQTVFTTDTAGEVGSFYVNGNYLYVTTKRDPSTNHSKFQRVTLSSGTKSKLYEFSSSKYEITQFSIAKTNNTKSFFLGLKGVDDKAAPASVYVSNYVQRDIRVFVGIDKTASFIGLNTLKDDYKLAGLFKKGTTLTIGYVDVDETDPAN